MTSGPSTQSTQRLSVPPRHTKPPRALTDTETATLLRIADCLIPAAGPNPKASDAEEYVRYLDLAISARTDVFDQTIAAIAALAEVSDEEMWTALKHLWTRDRDVFDPLSAIVACAYFMTPQVKDLIGYPGQSRDVARLDEAADQLGTGILEPVLERGFIYVSAAGE